MQGIGMKKEEKKGNSKTEEGREKIKGVRSGLANPPGSQCAPPLDIHHHPEEYSAITLLPASLALSISELSFRLRLHPCGPALSPASVSVLLQMLRHGSQPLHFLSLPLLSCSLRSTTITVPFLIEQLASRDRRNQASSSRIK